MMQDAQIQLILTMNTLEARGDGTDILTRSHRTNWTVHDSRPTMSCVQTGLSYGSVYY